MRSALLLSAFYLLVTLVMTRPIFNVGAMNSAAYRGDARLIIWTLAWDNHAVLDRLPLFDANIYYPAPHSLQYNEHLFGISLFTLPIYAATRNPILAYNVVWLLTFLAGTLAMHAFARRLTGSHLAAVAAAVIFQFSFYNMLHAHGHLSLVWTWLLPLSLLLADRWTERPTWPRAIIWGATVLLAVLSNWYLAVMALVSNGVYLAWRQVLAGPGAWRRRATQLAVVAVMGAAAVLPFAIQYHALAPATGRELRGYSADWAAYLVPPQNTFAGRWWLAHVGPGPRWIWGETTLFLGWTALALALAGAATSLRRRHLRSRGVFAVLILLGFALSFGPRFVDGHQGLSAFGLLARLPGLAGLRVPARFSLLVILGMAVSAAFGARVLLQRFGRAGAVVVAVLVPLMLSEWFVVDFPGGRPRPVVIPPIYRSAALRSARALVSLPDYRGTPNWPLESDYLLFSTVHWRPIVNGAGRSEPANQLHVISHMKAFPGPHNAATMRQLGVDDVIVHTARFADRQAAADLIRVAMTDADYELVEQMGPDYLFRVRPQPANTIGAADAAAKGSGSR